MFDVRRLKFPWSLELGISEFPLRRCACSACICERYPSSIGVTARPSISSTSPRSRIHFARNAGRPCCHIDVKIRITPRTARVVDADRLVDFDFAVHRFGRCEGDFAKRNANVGMQLAADVNPSVNSAAALLARISRIRWNFRHAIIF